MTEPKKKISMKVVSKKSHIDALEDEKGVHLSFRPSSKDLLTIAEKCPNLKVVNMPQSYINTLSKSMMMFLDIQGIELKTMNVWGHRSDITRYYEENVE